MKLNRDDLHEFQNYGVDFIINKPISALMLECGLGKTITTLTAVSDLMYVCQECRHELVILEHQTRLEADRDKKLKKLKTAIKRISGKTDIRPYKNAIEWVEKNLYKNGWFQSTEEIMTALELIHRNVKAHHQVRVYDYFVDFVLPDYKVILEIDGKLFHGNDRAEKEHIRDEVIAGKFGDGWEVVRIDAENINMNITKLVPAIKAVLKERHKRKNKT